MFGILATAVTAEPARKPNVLFILVDDLGWADTTPYGSTYHNTSNLKRLAERSVRFTSYYAASPLCSPTRSSLLTGLYPARTGITALRIDPSTAAGEIRIESACLKGMDGKTIQEWTAKPPK